MITYVNTVFVSNDSTSALATSGTVGAITNGQFVVYDVDNNTYSLSSTTKRFKIGMGTGKTTRDHKGVVRPQIKWSNIINVDDIKSVAAGTYAADTEDKVYIDFSNIDSNVVNVLNDGGKRVIVRLTFKDMPHRYRKWTESYEYVTAAGDDAAAIAAGIAKIINKEWKRARVEVKVGSVVDSTDNDYSADDSDVAMSGTEYFRPDANQASTTGTMIEITALPYDDDNVVDSLSWANKVRFNANIYYTDPAAEGWEALNKKFPTGVTITKFPGKQYAASAKLVRDREAQGMGYEGILNRGDGTWPIIKPDMNTKLDGQYDYITIEFENMYRAADDIFRKTKQAVEIYYPNGAAIEDAFDNVGVIAAALS